MRRLIAVLMTLISLNLNAQHIGIGTRVPHSSAILDISDTTKGILIPRLTMLQRLGIQNPAEGLMVYQTDSTKGYWSYTGNKWTQTFPRGNLNGEMLYWENDHWNKLPSGTFNQSLFYCDGKPQWGGCSPLVVTSGISSINRYSAVINGNVINQGGSAVTQRGVVFDSVPNPTYERSSKTMEGSGIGPFTSYLYSLSPGKSYHTRAYAINNFGIGYGGDSLFVTTAITPPILPPGPKLAQKLADNPDDTLYYQLVVRGGMLDVFNDSSKLSTMFVPNNQAMKIFITTNSNGLIPISAPNAVFSSFINNNIPPSTAAAIVQYHTAQLAISSDGFSEIFPDEKILSRLNPSQSNPSYYFPIYATKRPNNLYWLNNISITSVNTLASNGIIHHISGVSSLPQRSIWERISTDSSLTYMKALIIRADSGASTNANFQYWLSNIGPDFTIFTPVDTAFRSYLNNIILQQLLSQGTPYSIASSLATIYSSTPDVFNNPNFSSLLSPSNMRGILANHIISNQAFTNNFPIVEQNYPTFINNSLPNYPGISIKAVFGTNPSGIVINATVKGIGNTVPSKIFLSNAAGDPTGTCNQIFFNGILHKIDSVLSPQ